MTSTQEVNQQLKRLGLSFHYWGRNEIKQLTKTLTEGEKIQHCINGHYVGGYAMLVATDHRLLLIDSKPMFLTMEAIWYDKIGQIDYYYRLLNATICISTPNKEVRFTTWNGKNLHELLLYSQLKMAEAKKESSLLSNVLERSESRIAELETKQEPEPSPSYSFNKQIADTQAAQPEEPHMYIPEMQEASTPYDLTLYKATHLPFSRRRYYARSTT